jgi:hypothetical protein
MKLLVPNRIGGRMCPRAGLDPVRTENSMCVGKRTTIMKHTTDSTASEYVIFTFTERLTLLQEYLKAVFLFSLVE